MHNVLPDRKLVVVAGRDPSTLPADAVKRQAVLALWYVEEQVKKRYASLVGRLEKGSFDTVENFKRVCMTIMAVSARGRPRVSLMKRFMPWWLTTCPGLLLLLLGGGGGSMVHAGAAGGQAGAGGRAAERAGQQARRRGQEGR